MTIPASAEADASIRCPQCGAASVRLSWWLQAKPIGSFSLAGAQMKMSAFTAAKIECKVCGWKVLGRLIDAVMNDQGQFVSGHFEGTKIVDQEEETDGHP